MKLLSELSNVAITSILSIIMLFIIAKSIGNRQMSQMSMFDYVNGITIGSIAAELATDIENYHKPLLAMILYGCITFLISYLTNKSIKLRRFMEGKALLLLKNDQLNEKNLMHAKLDVDEFLTLCRNQGYFNLDDIHTAVLEANGKLSILPKSTKRPVTPEDLKLSPEQEYPLANVIIDGKILEQNLKATGNNRIWLERQIHAYGVSDINEIVLATCDINNKLNIYVKLHRKMTQDIFE